MVNSKSGLYTVEDLLIFLKKRVGLLDGVVLSGGESTLYDLENICKDIKKLFFNIKLDTNGSNPNQLKNLINKNLVDYVAMDFKSTKEKFKDITNSSHYDNFIESLKILTNSNTDFEVRTTLHGDLLNENDINEMQKILIENNYEKEYFIQNFLDAPTLGNLEKPTNFFDNSKLADDLNIVWRN